MGTHDAISHIDALGVSTKVDLVGTKEGHYGEHYQTLKAFMADKDQVKAWNEWIVKEVATLPTDRDPIVVFVSERGRDRAVTVARFFTEVVKKAGYHVVGPFHLQYEKWPKHPALCSTCEKCCLNYPPKELLFLDLPLVKPPP